MAAQQPTSTLMPTLPIPAFANPLLLDHDHKDPKLHQLSTPNFMELAHVAWDPILLDKYPLQQYGEGDIVDHYAFVAALVSGFSILDIQTPEQPQTLSFTLVPPGYVADIKAAEGGNLALLGMQGGLRTALRGLGVGVPPLPPTAIPPPDGLRGVQAWDTTDKTQPVLAGYFYVENGCHMLSVLDWAGATYVFCAPNDNTVRVFQLLHAGPAVVFKPVATWSPEDLLGQAQWKVNGNRSEFTHDMTVQLDPLTHKPVMLVSFWNRGIWAVDVENPAAPKTLGTWAGEGALLWGGDLHTSMATAINGKRIVVTIPEYAKIPAVFVLDATDYAHMTVLAQWQASPEEGYGDSPALFSTHNFQIVDHKVYLAMYHGGLWVLDLANPTQPFALGYALPTAEPGVGFGFIAGAVPDTWDVVVANGYVFAVDIATGLWVYHVEGDPAGDASYDSFA